MATNPVSYTFDSTLETVNRVEAMAEHYAAAAGFAADEIQGIAMAVREATIKAVEHGNPREAGKRVQVTFEQGPARLRVGVRDEGPGFDGSGLPDPLAPDNLLKSSGRGIFLMRSFMDEVHFRNLHPGTEIMLIKRVRGAAADHKEKETS